MAFETAHRLRLVCTAALVSALMFILQLPNLANDNSDSAIYNDKGLSLFRQQNYEEALKNFEIALSKAAADSLDQLTAANNIVVVYDAMNKPHERWQAQQYAYEIRKRVQGIPVPLEYVRQDFTESEEQHLAGEVANARSL